MMSLLHVSTCTAHLQVILNVRIPGALQHHCILVFIVLVLVLLAFVLVGMLGIYVLGY